MVFKFNSFLMQLNKAALSRDIKNFQTLSKQVLKKKFQFLKYLKVKNKIMTCNERNDPIDICVNSMMFSIKY